MIPRLYAAGSTKFRGEGLGALAEASEGIADTAINGVPTIELTYPTSGRHAAEIAERCIIVADQDRRKKAQPYIIKTIDKSTPGIMRIRAEHLAVELLDGIGLEPYTSANLTAALSDMAAHATDPIPVTINADFATAIAFNHAVPSSVKRALGGMEGSILDTYGGEWSFTDLAATLSRRVGQDNGVVIRAGKNLTSLRMTLDWSGVYTGIYPYWRDSQDGTVVQLAGDHVYSLGTFDFTRNLVLDAGQAFQEAPTPAELLTFAQNYAATHTLTAPAVTWDVQLQDLRRVSGFEDVALLEEIALGDTVTIYLPSFDVNASARVTSERYDFLRDRYEELEIGSVRASLSGAIYAQTQAIAAQAQALANAEGSLYEAIQTATEQITGNLGGYVVTRSNAAGEPYEILIMDTPDINTATKVWRWNQAGLGYSSNGYNGPYTTAITQDGKIVADFITTGTLNANLVTITNLIVNHLKATSGNQTVEVDGGGMTTKQGNNWRTWTYNKGGGGGEQGVFFAYGGTRPNLNGNAGDPSNDSTSRMTYMDANAIGIGVNKQGVPTGSANAASFYAYNDGYMQLYDASGNLRGRISALNGMTIWSATGAPLAYVTGSGIWLYDGTRSRVIISAESGNIQGYDANGQERYGLYPSEGQLVLYNSSGTRTVQIRGDGTASSAPLPVNQGGLGSNDGALMLVTAITTAPSWTTGQMRAVISTADITIAGSTIPAYSVGHFVCSGNIASLCLIARTGQIYWAYRNTAGVWTQCRVI